MPNSYQTIHIHIHRYEYIVYSNRHIVEYKMDYIVLHMWPRPYVYQYHYVYTTLLRQSTLSGTICVTVNEKGVRCENYKHHHSYR